MDRLLLRHNGGAVVTIDGATHIGRGRGEARTWYTEREQPTDFADLALVIHIDGSPYMSRNHAGIRREGDGFTVQDLNSANGTFKNGVRMDAGVHYPLAVGDRLAMGVDLFEVGRSPDDFARELAPGQTAPHRGVLGSEWYLGVAGFDDRAHARLSFYTSVARIANELHQRGYRTEVHGVRPADVAERDSRVIEIVGLREVLESLGRRAFAAGADAHTFFQYSGHGVHEGLVVNTGELLTPRLLFEACGAIRGKKLLVLDACYAGVFLAHRGAVPPETAVLAATRTVDDAAYVEGPGMVGVQGDLAMTQLSRRLWQLLRERSGAFNLLSERAALEAAFASDGDGMMHVQEPGMNTVTYTVCLRSVSMGAIAPPEFQRIVLQQRTGSA